jgi:hypothetical protein
LRRRPHGAVLRGRTPRGVRRVEVIGEAVVVAVGLTVLPMENALT